MRHGLLTVLSASMASAMVAMPTGASAQPATQRGAAPASSTREAGAAPLPTDADTLPEATSDFTSTAHAFRVTPIKGLSRPFALAFLPDGNMLVTEREGRLRIVRNGIVDPKPIAGMPDVLDVRLKGLQDLALHPRFTENRLIYFTYYKAK